MTPLASMPSTASPLAIIGTWPFACVPSGIAGRSNSTVGIVYPAPPSAIVDGVHAARGGRGPVPPPPSTVTAKPV